MIDIDTFLTTLYVMVDDFGKSQWGAANCPGPAASLSVSEVVALAVFSQWSCFRNQRDFYRFADTHLRKAFPTLPARTQFNRLLRSRSTAIVAFVGYLVDVLHAREVLYEILDTSGVPVRNVKRRGRGWLAGQASIGWCTRLGWYNGFRLLLAGNPQGVITGFGYGEGSAKEQPLTETLLALRIQSQPAIPSVGRPALGVYIADMGFAGERTHAAWQLLYQAEVITEPQIGSRKMWPKPWRRWLHSIRQLVETIYGKLMEFCRLDRDRPHHLTGFHANLAAKVALHNFCIWLNEQTGRPRLAFADLLGW